ncbi:hypothetical protein BGX26_011681 [Mortierella sp. AD094]|nr:hypothetical protein BGX26_011681 [Mortierella sp. AD094]
MPQVITEQHVVKGQKHQGFLMRKWKISLMGINANGEEEPLPYVERVEYLLHETFAQPLRKVTEYPFVLQEKGWGEFDMKIKLYFVDNATAPFVLDHDLNFQATHYEVPHTLTFKPDLKSSFLKLLNQPVETITDRGSRLSSNGNGVDAKTNKRHRDDSHNKKSKRAKDYDSSDNDSSANASGDDEIDIHALAEKFQLLEADDLIDLVKLVKANQTSDMYVKEDGEDRRTVEESLKQKLGDFYKDIEHLPYGSTAAKLSLPMFGQLLDKPTTSKKRTFFEIVESDIELHSGFCPVAMVARSGAGKTSMLVQISRKHFVIYAMCQTKKSRTLDFTNENFSILASDVERIAQDVPFPEQDAESDDQLFDKIKVYDNNLNPGLTPEQFFREQINGGAKTITKLIRRLSGFDSGTIQTMLSEVDDQLRSFLQPRGQPKRGLVIALNEAHIADTDILTKKLVEMLGMVINMDGCEIPPEKKIELTGRVRFTTNVVDQLAQVVHSRHQSKQKLLNDAVDESLMASRKPIEANVQLLLDTDHSGAITDLFSRMVIASNLTRNEITFVFQEEIDFVNYALCELQDKGDELIDVVEEYLKKSDDEPKFLKYLDQFSSILPSLGTSSSLNAEIFERLIGILPFVKDVEKLPRRCKDIKFMINELGTASQLGYPNGVKGDVEFLRKSPCGELLFPDNLTRPGLVLPLSDGIYMSGALKLWSSAIDSDTHLPNTRSSDLRLCFCKADGSLNMQIEAYRDDFESFQKIKGIPRIHLAFPSVQGGTPKSHVDGDDVLVYIDLSNMEDLFDEGDYTQTLKGMVKYMCDSKESDMQRGQSCACKKTHCNLEKGRCPVTELEENAAQSASVKAVRMLKRISLL